MKQWRNIELEIKGNRAYLQLNRPEVHNALNPALIHELGEALKVISGMDETTFVILSGKGKSFCAGADIHWFASATEKTETENQKEYLQLAELFRELYLLPKITIAGVHGNVRGGANGLVAACDFAVAEENTAFAFGEIRLGIIPATIMPFIARRLSVQQMKKYMYSGEIFNGLEAMSIGLADETAHSGQLMEKVNETVERMKYSPPEALNNCKQLITGIENGEVSFKDGPYTSALLSRLIQSPEGREGLTAFREKRKPQWPNKKSKQQP